MTEAVPIARCGYYEYAKITEVFEMRIPGLSEEMLGGLEGSSKKNQALLKRGKNSVMRGEDTEVEKED